MQASEAARKLGVTVKALRYYESAGLIHPERKPNGYRNYREIDLKITSEIVELTSLGLTVDSTRPFVECLQLGHDHGDSCIESLAAYRKEIDRLEELIASLASRRNQLREKLEKAAGRGFTPESSNCRLDGETWTRPPRYGLPDDLPAPEDDGGAAHLVGLSVPPISLRASNGEIVNLGEVASGRWVLFVYPTTGVPGEDMPLGWDHIPGARGCTPEACGFRDNLGAIFEAGATAVFGLSVQKTRYQADLASNLGLPYLLLSDSKRRLGRALDLPTFDAGGDTFYKRLTLVIRGRNIEHAFYPVFPPHEHAKDLAEWLKAEPLISVPAT